jgi:hypothetical protein
MKFKDVVFYADCCLSVCLSASAIGLDVQENFKGRIRF